MKLSASQRASLAETAALYAGQVGAAEGYLASRGIPAEVAATYLLGAVANPREGDEDMAGRLAIPYLTPAGVVDIRFRAMTDGQTPKYLGRLNSVTRMFNTRALLTDSPVVVVCEGEIDALVMDGIVGVPAVGVPGVSNWKPHFRLLLEDFDRVLVFCDGDQPGRDFGKRVTGELDNARMVLMPEGMDVNESYLEYGADWLRGKAA